MPDPNGRVPDDHVPPAGLKDGQRRTDWAAHREQVRRTNRARLAAVNQLIALYPQEFDELHAMCAAELGVKPMGRRSK